MEPKNNHTILYFIFAIALITVSISIINFVPGLDVYDGHMIGYFTAWIIGMVDKIRTADKQ